MNQEEIMLEAELRRIEERELEERQWEDAMDRKQLERENERLRAERDAFKAKVEELEKEINRMLACRR